MTDVALIFPGQGAQSVGMGRDFYESFTEAKEVFDRAEAILGNGLLKVMFEGPEEKLKTTQYTQPAIFTMSSAIYEVLKASPKFAGINPKFCCGLSLGEYSALYAGGALGFEETLKLLQKRSSFMEEACNQNKGTMAAVIGLDRAKIEEICAKTGAEVANFNSPQQIVISGFTDKVGEACKLMEEAGAKNVVPLSVAGAFHSSLMQPAQDKFMQVLSEVPLNEANTPIIANVNAKPAVDIESIRKNLAGQITSSVQWVDTIEYIKGEGVTQFLEIGPGKVLKGLIRRIDKSLSVNNIEVVGDIEALAL